MWSAFPGQCLLDYTDSSRSKARREQPRLVLAVGQHTFNSHTQDPTEDPVEDHQKAKTRRSRPGGSTQTLPDNLAVDKFSSVPVSGSGHRRGGKESRKQADWYEY